MKKISLLLFFIGIASICNIEARVPLNQAESDQKVQRQVLMGNVIGCIFQGIRSDC